jgi:hypothetical protein
MAIDGLAIPGGYRPVAVPAASFGGLAAMRRVSCLSGSPETAPAQHRRTTMRPGQENAYFETRGTAGHGGRGVVFRTSDIMEGLGG